MIITIFFRNATARCCDPFWPIKFFSRFSVLSAYVDDLLEWEGTEWRMRITTLFSNAIAKYSAPASPIWLLLRSNMISVCENILFEWKNKV